MAFYPAELAETRRLFRAGLRDNSFYSRMPQCGKQQANYPLSVEKAAEITHNMYKMEITLPESRHSKSILLKMYKLQTQLIQITDEKL